MYLEEVEKYFIQKRERAASLSPIDWPIVKSWEERGIPLEVVFKGIDTAFARFREKKDSEEEVIRSLAYCQYDVENCWQTYQEMVLGKPISESQKARPLQTEQEKIRQHLNKLITQLTELSEMPAYQQISEALHQTIFALDSLRSQIQKASLTFDSAQVHGQLKELEEQLILTIRKTLPDTQIEHLFMQAEQKLVRYKEDMNSHIYQETLQAVIHRELRDLFSLPAFDFF
jgi:hypothetical protein